jgi:ubiquinone/menaquinone biosynthesis C-methylase UbiE
MKMVSFVAFALLLAGGIATASMAAQEDDQYDVPYVPTPMKTVAKMLDMAKVGPSDIVYDLGSGDGRIVVAAVRDYGARKAVGVDINPVRIREANENARRANVTDKVKFAEDDVFEFDFSEATVLTMYLLTEVNVRLRPRVLSLLKPGTRVVSHDFDMAEWEPDDVASMDSFRHVYLWIVPAKVEGSWEISVGETKYLFSVEQQFQRVFGQLHADGWTFQVQSGRLLGEQIDFIGRAIDQGHDVPARYTGKVIGVDLMEGTVEIGGVKTPFTARRIGARAG